MVNKTKESSPGRMQAAYKRAQRSLKLLSDRVRLLEAENTRLARLLKQQGVEVETLSSTATELPPPLLEPLTGEALAAVDLSQAERELLNEIRGEQPIYFLAACGAKVDVGHWFSRRRLWSAATAEALLMFAHGKRAFVEVIPFQYLKKSLYNHVTGEVVLLPALETMTRTLPLAPLEGYQLLAQIYGGVTHA